MIDIIFKEGKYVAKGTFDMGILGKFENRAYDDTEILINFDVHTQEMIVNGERSNYWGSAMNEFLALPKDSDAIAVFMTTYYNKREKQLCIKHFNDLIWYEVFDQLVDTDYPIYEIEEAIRKEYQGKINKEVLRQFYNELYEAFCEKQIYRRSDNMFYEQMPNDGSVEKPDVEGCARRVLKFFNFEGFATSIKRQGLYLSGQDISFQVEDGWGANIFCAAYCRMDEHFVLQEWANF